MTPAAAARVAARSEPSVASYRWVGGCDRRARLAAASWRASVPMVLRAVHSAQRGECRKCRTNGSGARRAVRRRGRGAIGRGGSGPRRGRRRSERRASAREDGLKRQKKERLERERAGGQNVGRMEQSSPRYGSSLSRPDCALALCGFLLSLSLSSSLPSLLSFFPVLSLSSLSLSLLPPSPLLLSRLSLSSLSLPLSPSLSRTLSLVRWTLSTSQERVCSSTISITVHVQYRCAVSTSQERVEYVGLQSPLQSMYRCAAAPTGHTIAVKLRSLRLLHTLEGSVCPPSST
eukprot:scaffold60459_cov31-Tisochrysis_lutea.AAC.3